MEVTKRVSLWKRICAFLTDLIISVLPLYAIMLVFGYDIILELVDKYFLLFSLLGLAFIAYILFKDGLSGGQSLAKRAVRLRVVDYKTGRPCTFKQSFLRNLLMLFQLFWFIEGIVLLFSNRRLGDRLAGTIVTNVEKK